MDKHVVVRKERKYDDEACGKEAGGGCDRRDDNRKRRSMWLQLWGGGLQMLMARP